MTCFFVIVYKQWRSRLQIALATAQGLIYLHCDANPPTIQRDIRANNILLDAHCNTKVVDFRSLKASPYAQPDGH